MLNVVDWELRSSSSLKTSSKFGFGNSERSSMFSSTPARTTPQTTTWTTSPLISGDPDCSSSTLLRPTTPKATTTWTTSNKNNQKVRIISGDPAYSLVTLLRPTTPKTTTTAWTCVGWSLKNGNWDNSFKSIVESKANVNGVGTWDDNFIQKFTTYSFKSVVESKANVNGVGTWDDNSLSLHSNFTCVSR